jgi:hypothetical protein
LKEIQTSNKARFVCFFNWLSERRKVRRAENQRYIPLVAEDAGLMSRLENGGARRKPDQYHVILRGFATPQARFPSGLSNQASSGTRGILQKKV